MSNLAHAMTAPERFAEHNYVRLAELIHTHSGIKMPPNKQVMLSGRLRRRLSALGLPDVDAYCRFLFDMGGLDEELVHLINAVSTNKTDFFREPAHFDFLVEQALPELVAAGRRQVKLWSAAASTGAEAYTLAMLLEESRRTGGADYSILATDICTEVLEQAHAGRFPVSMIAPVPADLRRKYVMQSRDPKVDQVRMSPQLRAKITVARLNLMDERYPFGRDMDFVFCRNILIYFDKKAQGQVLARLCQHIRPGGYLILGHSESAVGPDLPILHIVNTIFQRV